MEPGDGRTHVATMRILLPWAITLVSVAFAIATYMTESSPGRSEGGARNAAIPPTAAEPKLQPDERITRRARPQRQQETPVVPACLPNEAAKPQVCEAAPPCPQCPPSDNQPCPRAAALRACEARLAEHASWNPFLNAAVRSQSLATARRATLETLLQEDLQITPEQTQWLTEAACALRELRWHAVEGINRDLHSAVPHLLIQSDRAEILADMEKMLGAGAYTRFREMGGIGLLNDTLECADQESSP